MTAEQRSRVLVTGGSGFIGRRLVRALLETGAEVTVADLREPTEPGVHAVVGDLRDESVAAQAVSPGTDTIFHLAAVTSVLRSLEDPVGTYQTNVQATATLLELARTRGVGSFILASTNAVVGDVGRNVITEQAPLRPLTPYGATKAAGEMLVSCYTAAYGIAGCALRFSNVYGPGMQQKDSFVPRLMRAARDGHGVQVYGDGTQVRDLIHVDDIVSGLLLAWRSRSTGSIILGAGESVTVNDIIAAARSVTGAPIPVEHIAPKPGEMPAVIVDISAARALGYRPTHDLKSGIATVWPEFAPEGGAQAPVQGRRPRMERLHRDQHASGRGDRQRRGDRILRAERRTGDGAAPGRRSSSPPTTRKAWSARSWMRCPTSCAGWPPWRSSCRTAPRTARSPRRARTARWSATCR